MRVGRRISSKRNASPNLEILDEPFEESYKVFSFSDIARNSFLEEVFWQSCTTTQPN